MRETRIQVKNLSKVYTVREAREGFWGHLLDLLKPRYRQVPSVKDVSFGVKAGECVGILGANGSGKSTLIKMLTGLIIPSDGITKVLGEIPYHRRRLYLKEIGVVFGHKSSLWWDLALEESLESHRVMYGVSVDDFSKRKKEICTALNLNHVISRPVKYLSLGERVKAELAANMLHSPKILFLDEPTVGLDLVSKHELRNYLRKWVKETGGTLVLTTHDMVDVEACCDRVILIDQGSVQFQGNYAELVSKLHKKLILELKSSERVMTPEQRFSFEQELKNVSTLLGVLDSTEDFMRIEVDKDFSFRKVINLSGVSDDWDFHLRAPSLEEALRDFYQEKAVV